MLEDLQVQRDETDLTHLDEILELPRLVPRSSGSSKNRFRERSLSEFCETLFAITMCSMKEQSGAVRAVGLEVELAESSKAAAYRHPCAVAACKARVETSARHHNRRLC